MKNKIICLFNVKSMVTLLLTLVFALLSLKDKISGEQFLVIFTTIIAFYFGSQHDKGGSD
ncbi:MAG: hypothetical protein NC320_07725 [Clostridium sp.]|nr:hypothetical protein [Clostridium sp.]MCM1548270.1 hypothetical protein [Ruminococcus sp.]